MATKDDMRVAATPAFRDFAPLMTEKNNVAPDELVPTPTECAQPRRFSDFATVGEALEYAAQGSRGLNFNDPRGRLVRAYRDRKSVVEGKRVSGSVDLGGRRID